MYPEVAFMLVPYPVPRTSLSLGHQTWRCSKREQNLCFGRLQVL